jgi:diguanylate cyclase (GGDEF)-like protein
MAKQVRLPKATAKIREVPARPALRAPRATPGMEAAGGPTQSDPMRLAAEVARLEAELAAMRERVAELETRAESDPLTGVMNRRGFERELKRAGAYVRRYGGNAALVYLDLDGFKAVNDRHGHAAGDWALGRLARLIAGHVRASDVVARIGGDEIVALLWNLRADQAEAKARAIEEMIAASPFEHSGKRFKLGLSAGFTMLVPGDTAAAALARADAAMYARKRERRA